MKYDEVHFENAKGHAVALLKQAEKALEEGIVQYAGWALADARSYLVTMSLETDREGATDAARDRYVEVGARYEAVLARYKAAKAESEKETDAMEELEKAEKEEEVAEQESAREHEEALIRFDVECNRIEAQLDDYANELAENHSESYGTENAIFCKLAKKLEERRELLSGDALDARWLRVEHLKRRFHDLKRLGTIARRFWKIKEAFFGD